MISAIKFFLQTQTVASARLNQLALRPLKRLALTTALIENQPLRRDIESALLHEGCGVRILWGPEGCGKTTLALEVCHDLISRGKLAGALYLPMTATDNANPIHWLREAVSDGFPGHIVRDPSSFAKLLTRHERAHGERRVPVVIVLDQVENMRRTDAMNAMIKSLAEQSVLTKTFVILVITKDPTYAIGLVDLNGRTKVRLVSGDSAPYKWTQSQVDAWLREKGLQDSRVLRDAGLKAGTPGFLMDNAQEKKPQLIEQAASFCNLQWEAGGKMIREYLASPP